MAVKGDQTAVQVSKQVQHNLIKQGYLRTWRRVDGTKHLKWLGFIIHSLQGKLKISARKIEHLQHLLATINHKQN